VRHCHWIHHLSLEAGDEGDFLKQQQTLFGTVNSDIGGIRAYREMDQMMRAMWLLLCRLLDMWTRCRHPAVRNGGRCGCCLEKHGYFVPPETWHSVTELRDAEDYCRSAGVELLGSSMARDELLADCEVKFLEAVGALHVWLKLLSPPHPEAYTRALMKLGGRDSGLYFLGQWQAAARRTVLETRLVEMPEFMVDLPQPLVETMVAVHHYAFNSMMQRAGSQERLPSTTARSLPCWTCPPVGTTRAGSLPPPAQ
jgi:hypothetical protein